MSGIVASRGGHASAKRRSHVSDESPLVANLSFILFGEGNVPWLVRELILKAEADPTKRPRVIIG